MYSTRVNFDAHPQPRRFAALCLLVNPSNDGKAGVLLDRLPVRTPQVLLKAGLRANGCLAAAEPLPFEIEGPMVQSPRFMELQGEVLLVIVAWEFEEPRLAAVERDDSFGGSWLGAAGSVVRRGRREGADDECGGADHSEP